jgi:hypothetical protein
VNENIIRCDAGLPGVGELAPANSLGNQREVCIPPGQFQNKVIQKSSVTAPVIDSSTKVGDLPPNSNETGIKLFAAAFITILPTRVPPGEEDDLRERGPMQGGTREGPGAR